MTYDWRVETTTTIVGAMSHMLNALDREGWEVFSVFLDPAKGGSRDDYVRIVARKLRKPHK